jgi:hypothetical protein
VSLPAGFSDFRPGQQVISAAGQNRLHAQVRDLAGLAFDPAHFIRQGNVVTLRSKAASQNFPWECRKVGATKIKINIGSIAGIVPSNIFSELTIAATGTEYVVLTLTCTADAPSSAVMSVESAAPVPSATAANSPPGTCTDVLAIVQDGIPYQVRTRNLQVESEEVFREPVASPVPWEMNYIPWHRWKIVEAV